MDSMTSMGSSNNDAFGQADFFGMTDDNRLARDEALPLLRDGTWGKAEGLVFARHLKRGELSDALEVLGCLTNDGARAVLCQTGFAPQATGGRRAMLESVQDDLIRAAQLKMTGVELRDLDGPNSKPEPREKVFPGSIASPSFTRALQAVQQVLSAASVEVGVAGPGDLSSRASLLFIGAQAIERGVSGFGIEGIKGKFRLPDSVDLAGLRSIYGASAGAVAETQIRHSMPGWAGGRSAPRVSDLVHETAARVLRGPASVAGAEHLRTSLESGAIRDFAAVQGIRLAGQVLAKQGVQIDAPPVEQIAVDAGMQLISPVQRAQYVGPVVAQDHRASIIKTSRDGALVVAHKDLPEGVSRPAKGDVIHVKFGKDRMQVNIQHREQRVGVGR